MGESAKQNVAAGIFSARDIERLRQEDREDYKGKYPLQGDGFDGNLLQCQSCIWGQPFIYIPILRDDVLLTKEQETQAVT